MLIISPSDVEDERRAVTDTIVAWNAHAGQSLGVSIDPVRWESHSRPELGDRPQSIINRQLVDGCDFGIAIFWSRLGTPTGGHKSGSAEEIERLLAMNKNVMVYLKTAPIPQRSLRDDQYQRLQSFKKTLGSRGLYTNFETETDLTRFLTLHLTSLLSEMLIENEGLDNRAGRDIKAVVVELAAARPNVIIKPIAFQDYELHASDGTAHHATVSGIEQHGLLISVKTLDFGSTRFGARGSMRVKNGNIPGMVKTLIPWQEIVSAYEDANWRDVFHLRLMSALRWDPVRKAWLTV